MATLAFNGTSQYLVSASGPGGLDAAQTVAALIKRTTATVDNDCILSTVGTGPAVGYSLFMNNSATEPRPEMFIDNAGGNTSPPTSGWGGLGTDLLLVAVSRGSGETPRFHARNITAATAWKHNDGETARTTNPDACTVNAYVGVFHFPGVGDFDWFNGAIGLLGWWNGTEFSDGQVETLGTNLQTSDWHNHAAGTPSSLTELTGTSPTDLEGLVTWTNNGATLTGDAMAAWTFDGTGVLDPPPDLNPPLGGDVTEPSRNGTFDETMTGGIVTEYQRNGTVDEPTRSGSYDESLTSGEVL